MNAADRTTDFLFDNGEYFVAHTAGGGAAVGMNNVCSLRVPPHHPLKDEILRLTEADVEAFVDAQISAGLIAI